MQTYQLCSRLCLISPYNQCLYVGKLLNSVGLQWVPGPLVSETVLSVTAY